MTAPAIAIDASHGEGGGQVLRTALSLAVALGRPVTLRQIRARRPRPGLQPQHLTVVRALGAISDALVTGDALDSTDVTFVPRTLRGGTYHFDIGAIRGSAGSVALLFQALLLPLSLAAQPSRLRLRGGTHVPWSPPVPYLTAVFLPALGRIGVQAALTLDRWGWYPAGGGEVDAVITPSRSWRALRWAHPTGPPILEGVSAVSRLPRSIAERQRARALDRLGAAGLSPTITLVEDRTALGPGTLTMLTAAGESARAGFSALGRRGVRAETVADEAVDPLLAYLGSGATADDHLADQLIPFLALADGPSTFTCPALSTHLRTVAWVVEQMLPVHVTLDEGRPARVEVRTAPGAPQG
ncbi:MAG TPA: RNA 3'-terminal phosphate cyclase [Methylomirabilota bacterium]|nr:RNA 3'-terminal phosphate cyclase [Methylomirabilota bacterium]